MTRATTSEISEGVSRLNRVLAVVREQDPEMPAQTLVAFLYIATHQGCTVGDLAGPLNVGQGVTSRIAARLANIITKERANPMDLISLEINPQDRRLRSLHLTKDGQEFLNKLVKALG